MATLRAAGLRAEADTSGEKIGYKIREAEMQKIPAMLIVGKKEAAEGTGSLRRHGVGDQGSVALAACIEALVGEVNERRRPGAAATA